VVSVATTTGYASPTMRCGQRLHPVLLMFLGCFASCAGSTGGGIKMVRMVLLVKQARRELVRIIHPRVVNPVTLGRNIPCPAMCRRHGLHADLRRTMGLTMLMLRRGWTS
jgi:trk system potassium uptake protein TrkH